MNLSLLEARRTEIKNEIARLNENLRMVETQISKQTPAKKTETPQPAETRKEFRKDGIR